MNAARSIGLLVGLAADGVFGDPRKGHPVALFGRTAKRLEHALYRDGHASGVVHTALVSGGTVLLGMAVERWGRRAPVLQVATTALATWVVLGGASLAREGTAIGRELDDGDLAAARARLPHLCGRDPQRLDQSGLSRAAVESVAENTSDAVVAPLVWGAIAGVPGLLGYRAVNTLDAMIGHRSPRYRRFGWAAARLDDVANLVPARLAALLTTLCAPVVGGSAGGAWRVWRRDASAHPSPNAGQVEAAFAGALEIRLGGRIRYAHGVEDRPVLGDGRTPDSGHVTRAVELSRLVGTVAGVLSAVLAAVLGHSGRGRHGGWRRRPPLTDRLRRT